MPERTENPMDMLVTVAGRVLEVHDPGESGQCGQPDCVAAGLPGRCLPHRIADEVTSTWANRVYLTATVEPDESGEAAPSSRPGRGAVATGPQVVMRGRVKPIHHPARTHPAWCTGLGCREPGRDSAHVGVPDRVANLMVTLMHAEGEPPVVTLTDLADDDAERATVVVPATFAGSLAQAVRLTGLRAVTAD